MTTIRMKQIGSRIVRAVAAAAGLGLLVLIAPRRSPWEMVRFGIDGDSIRLLYVLAFAAVLTTLLCTVGRPRRASTIAVAALLFVSLIPASPLGRGVMLNLLLGSAGTALLTFGIATVAVRKWIEAAGRAISMRLERLPRWIVPLSTFVFVLAVCLAGGLVLFGGIPHVVDATAQLFHAKIFAAGHLWAPLPEPSESFDLTHMIQREGRWYSQYPPGHVALLALGLLLRVPWLVNPLLAAAAVALLYLVGVEWYDEKTGRWASLCAASSPFVWILGASYMSHAAMLFFFALFLWAYLRTIRDQRALDACVAGFALGCGLNVRPMTAAAVAAPFVLHALVRLARGRARDGTGGKRGRLAICCIAALITMAVPVGALLTFNEWTNGDPMLFGYEALHGRDALPGFGHGGWWGRPHTPLRGWIATENHLNGLNQYLFGLPLPSLLLPLVGLLWVRPRWREGLLLASAGCLLAAHFFYWYQDWVYGPRFLFAAVAPLMLLSARSLVAMRDALERRFPGRHAGGAAGLVLVVGFGYAWFVNVPALARFYGRNYEDGNAAVVAAVDRARLTDAIVLVPDLYYPSLFPRNDPGLDGDVVFARELSPESNRRLADRFAERDLYRIRSLDGYVLERVQREELGRPVVYPVRADVRLTVEALSFQLSHFAGGRGGNRSTGSFGGEWRNHDELWVSSESAGAEVGWLFDASEEQRRLLTLALTHSPESGIVGVWCDGTSLGEFDLYARAPGVTQVTLEDVRLRAGRNPLLLRVTGKNPRSRGYGMGLDFISID